MPAEAGEEVVYRVRLSVEGFLYLERELVERIDLLQVVQDEVDERGPSSRWSIVFSRFVYLLLCQQGFSHL
jgi:hypothetical protein